MRIGLEKIFPWNTCVQQGQEGVGRGFIARHGLARIGLGEGTQAGMRTVVVAAVLC